jgi:ssDNA-binding Zn-finger/Zn-ribbon topoisomerase 1
MRSPRFFCDNCGAEVGRNAGKCPRCGRFFGSVRCPACGFTGEEGLFKNGCPSCGYSSPGGMRAGGRRKENRAADSLPLWVYLVSILALLCAAAFFFSMIRG